MIDALFWIFYFLLLYSTIFLVLALVTPGKPADGNLVKFASWPKVSVLIPAHNEEFTIGRTIKSVLRLDYPKDKLDVIVINDGSDDGTGGVVRKFRKVLLINQPRGGKGSALNNGMRSAKGEFVACLDADSFVNPDTLKKMLPHFSADNVAAVTPVMKVMSPKTMWQKVQWIEYILSVYVRKILSLLNALNVTPGPFSIYRKSALRKIGGFDTKSIVEDQEIAYRMQRRHYRIVQSREGDVYTKAPADFKSLYKQRRRWFKGSLLTLFQYRKMMFNSTYGDFGLFQLPYILFGIMSCVFFIIFFTAYVTAPFVDNVIRVVNYGIVIDPSMFQINIHNTVVNYVFSTDFFKLFIMFCFSSMLLAVIVKSHREYNEKIEIREVPHLLVFFLLFFIFMSLVSFKSLIEVVLLRKAEW